MFLKNFKLAQGVVGGTDHPTMIGTHHSVLQENRSSLLNKRWIKCFISRFPSSMWNPM
jgi:hypothetical protein